MPNKKQLLSWQVTVCVFLAGCVSPPQIQDNNLRDRVIACGAGFSDDLVASLDATYKVTSPEGGVSCNFKEGAKALIFSKMPAKDRLRAYEDYIRCIETKLE